MNFARDCDENSLISAARGIYEWVWLKFCEHGFVLDALAKMWATGIYNHVLLFKHANLCC